MGSDLKLRIIEAARKLYEEKGYNNVSVRDITSVLGISVGNLTYHFKKKEELIEAVIMQDHARYQRVEIPQSLKELSELLKRIIDRKNNRLYYFNHYTQLAQICPAIYEMQLSVMKDIDECLENAFLKFESDGLLRHQSVQGYDAIIKVILSVCIHGLPALYLENVKDKDAETLRCIWSIIIPCLSEEGLEEYRKLLNTTPF